MTGLRALLRQLEGLARGRVDGVEPDLALLWAQIRLALGSPGAAEDILNQTVAVHGNYAPALGLALFIHSFIHYLFIYLFIYY